MKKGDLQRERFISKWKFDFSLCRGAVRNLDCDDDVAVPKRSHRR